jgi:hypothetical protein
MKQKVMITIGVAFIFAMTSCEFKEVAKYSDQTADAIHEASENIAIAIIISAIIRALMNK